MIWTVCGGNGFLVQQKAHQLAQDFAKKHTELAVQRIDAEEIEYQQIYSALTNISLFDSNKMVIVRSLSKNKQAVDNIEQIISSIPDITEVVFVEDKLDKRLNFYKTLKKQTEFLEFNDAESRSLPKWVVDYAKDQGGGISIGDAQYLVDRIGSNQMLLSNELSKLIIYDKQISRKTIDLLTPKTLNASIFDLLEAAFSGKTDVALRLYDELREQKTEPPQIIGLLSWQLYVLSVVQSAGERSSAEIASDAKLNPYVVNKSISIARKIAPQKLRTLVSELLDIDIKSKTSNRNSDEMMRLYLLEMSV